MRLSELLSIYPQAHWGFGSESEVLGLSTDSRTLKPGRVFIACRGSREDGHEYVSEAIRQKALCVVVEDKKWIPGFYKGSFVVVEDTQRAVHELASRFYGHPEEQLYFLAVTGTNGKTSVTYMIERILTQWGCLTGVLGTNNYRFGDRVWESQLTTPDPLTIYGYLHNFCTLGARAVAMEVSSHSLLQRRVDFIPFHVLVFTNLTRDHLDTHTTMESYFQAKSRLFNEIPYLKMKEGPFVRAVVNRDDPWGAKLTVGPRVKLWRYGQSPGSEFQFSLKGMDLRGSQVNLKAFQKEVNFYLPLIGAYNAYNAVAAMAACVCLGVPLEMAAQVMEEFPGVPGRMENIAPSHSKSVFVDYAHTDGALKAALEAIQQVKGEGQIITVFGCGGDRDKGKRPLMATAACQGSDIVILTSDNPRGEDPMRIIQEVKKGGDSRLRVQMDRRLAIQEAIDLAGSGDVVLIAGKGHESYQIIGDTKYNFSDMDVAREFLGESK